MKWEGKGYIKNIIECLICFPPRLLWDVSSPGRCWHSTKTNGWWWNWQGKSEAKNWHFMFCQRFVPSLLSCSSYPPCGKELFPIWSILLSRPSSVEMRTLTSNSMQGTNQLSQCLKMPDCLFDMHQPNHQTPLDLKKHVASKTWYCWWKKSCTLHPAPVGMVFKYMFNYESIMNMSHYVQGSFHPRCFAGYFHQQ